MDLFSISMEEKLKKSAPLADRMRPQDLDDFVGQGAVLVLEPGYLAQQRIEVAVEEPVEPVQPLRRAVSVFTTHSSAPSVSWVIGVRSRSGS